MNVPNERFHVKSLYNFQGDASLHQLTFPVGATILIESSSPKNSDWWFGEWKGRKGWFPRNYCGPPIPILAYNLLVSPLETIKEQSGPFNSNNRNDDDDEDNFQTLSMMGGPTDKINAVARNFGVSPTFNPAYEDLTSERQQQQRQWEDNPFRDDNHNTSSTRAQQPTSSTRIEKQKRKLFGKKAKVAALMQTVIRSKEPEDPRKPTVRIVSITECSSSFAGASAGSDTGNNSDRLLAQEQKALLQRQAEKRRQALLEREQQRTQYDQTQKRSWWSRMNNGTGY